MKTQAALLVALFGALLVAGSAAGPIRPVAEPKQETQYVFVKLLFEGHDQPNFDRWHANATTATVAQVAGVPVNYLIRMVDGKIPGTEKAAPIPAPKPQDPVPAHKPASQMSPETPPVPETPVQATPVQATPVQAAQPAPAQAAPVVVVTPAPAAATPALTPPSVTLITAPAVPAKAAEPEQKAVQTKPESGEGEITAPQSQAQQPQVDAQQPQEDAQQPQQPQQRHRRDSLWNTVQQALAAQQQQQQEAQEPAETPVEIRSTRNTPRVFVIGGRRLMGTTQVAPNQALVEYAIRTNASEPWAVRETVKRKLMASAAGFGQAQGTSLRGFYTLLKEHGVGYYPAMWVDGEQILVGEVAMNAPTNRFINGTKGGKNFQHKLYKHTDLVKDKAPARNATNVTIAEPAFVMANRSTNTQSTPIAAPAPQKTGFPAWAAALTAIGAITVAVALAGTVWRCVKERRKRQAEEDASHSEPLSPHSVQSHPGM